MSQPKPLLGLALGALLLWPLVACGSGAGSAAKPAPAASNASANGPASAAAAPTAQEFQAGRTASTDLLAGYANHVRAVMQVGGIEAVDWPSWASNLQDPRLIAANGMAIAYQSSTPGITYNTTRVSGTAVPR